MTSDEYRAKIKAYELTPVKPSYDGSTLHQGRSGEATLVPNPETMNAEERASMIELIMTRLGMT